MRLLIPVFSPPTGTWGGLTRVIAIADAALRKGHEVAFCAAGYSADTLRRKGYRVYDLPATTMLGLPPAISERMAAGSTEASPPAPPGWSVGSIWLVLAGMGYARAGYLKELVDTELAAMEDFRPDGLFTDLDPGAFLLAQITGLPIAANFQSIVTTGRGSPPWRWMRRAGAAVLRRYQKPLVTPDELAFGSHVLKIVPSIPQLDDADPARPDICYVGSLLGDLRPAGAVSFQAEAAQRYVFVYIGTGSLAFSRLYELLPRLFPAAGPVSCVVGAQNIESPARYGNVIFERFIPADELLPHCEWTICHGGQNTIIQSLWHGVPLLIFPGAIFERRYNAQKVAAAGAGYLGEKPDFSEAWLRDRMEKQTDCAKAAQKLGEAIQAGGGADAAIKAIEAHSGC